ncbi:hypothetical protein [Mesorhizobium sp. INR15]|uniref:hypothetical protein n=1 Tax=Mesorhizobium sp. INR15 TaxID=2654248 RepID=UPI0018966BFD|nr:hypothetical protein [Mesorhizobium sp. INR15]QPC92064.1 hypothetical protein GA829_16565 [Mesorhizobium sp. INR15]
MRYDYSARLRDDVISAVQTAIKMAGIVNISTVAEQVRVRNLAENVALEDIEHLVMQAAQLFGAAIEFDGLTAMGGMANGKTEDGIERLIVPVELLRSGPLQ